MKTVIVGSTNPVKLEVAREAFNWVFPTEEFEFITEAAVSGVPDQPFGLEETKRGATNRAKSCRAAFPLADYCVGLEGGIEEIDGEYWPSAWMCVEDRSGLCLRQDYRQGSRSWSRLG